MMPEPLPEKRERYFSIGGSGKLEDYTAIALFERQDGMRDAVLGIKLKNIPEISGFVAFIAQKFGIEHQYKPAMPSSSHYPFAVIITQVARCVLKNGLRS
jgi:hypothetical protein